MVTSTPEEGPQLERLFKNPKEFALALGIGIVAWVVIALVYDFDDLPTFLFGLTLLVIMLVSLSFLKFVPFSEVRFWREFADNHGGEYAYQPNLQMSAKGVMFRNNKSWDFEHFVKFVKNGRQWRVFKYYFGSREQKSSFVYTVIAVTFQGSFPNLFLDKKSEYSHGFAKTVGRQVSLPLEFEKKFTLYSAKEYEQEALEIFTPDVLVSILDDDLIHDVELIDQEIFIFTLPHIKNQERLQKELKTADKIVELLDDKLDRMKLQAMKSSPYIEK